MNKELNLHSHFNFSGYLIGQHRKTLDLVQFSSSYFFSVLFGFAFKKLPLRRNYN
jgi:hypothetical protein